MEIRYSCNQRDFKRYTTEETRKEFLIENLYAANEVVAVYSHVDRMVTLGCMPTTETVPIDKGIDIWHNFGTQYFLERREIGIFNICSMMSELGRETVSAYAAAKGGLKMLTKNIASEYGEYNIQCNGIGPGYIETPQTAPLRERQADGSRHPFDQFIIAKTPAARWGTTEDLVGPAVFLASDASNFVNGHVLYVDGGILAYIGKQPQ